MLYMVEHNVFYCLHLFNWSITSSAYTNELISLSIGAFNFVFGVITSLVLLFTGEYEYNVLYLIFVKMSNENLLEQCNNSHATAFAA